jgi:GTP-binding protein EngB required for normal cell division
MPDNFIIFTGRPNAGKSTTIKALTGVKVPIGKKPGTTTKINKYQISSNLFVVDMPGYGRKVDAGKYWEDKTKNRILSFIESKSDNIVAAIHVFNVNTFIEVEQRLAKKGFINLDVEMVQHIADTLGGYPFIAANKIDKGKEKDVMKNIDAFLYSLTYGSPLDAVDYIFPICAKNKIGTGQLKNSLVMLLNKKGFTNPFKFVT